MMNKWGKLCLVMIIGIGIAYYGCKKKEKEEKVRKVIELIKGNYSLPQLYAYQLFFMRLAQGDTLQVSVKSIDPIDGLIDVSVGDTASQNPWKVAYEVTNVYWVLEIPKDVIAELLIMHDDTMIPDDPITVEVKVTAIRWEKQPSFFEVGW
jgi:hypothetical protein